MSQQTTISGRVVGNNNNVQTVVSLQYILNSVGNNYVSTATPVPTGSWTPISQNNNTNFRFGYFTNLDISGSIKIAIGSTGSYASQLYPGDVAILTNSSSAQLWAQAYNTVSSSVATLQYFITEA